MCWLWLVILKNQLGLFVISDKPRTLIRLITIKFSRGAWRVNPGAGLNQITIKFVYLYYALLLCIFYLIFILAQFYLFHYYTLFTLRIYSNKFNLKYILAQIVNLVIIFQITQFTSPPWVATFLDNKWYQSEYFNIIC